MSHSQQPVRAFPINSQYKQSYRSPEESLVRNAERGLQQTVAAARERGGYEDEPRSYRPSSASARSGVDLVDADDPFTHFQTTRSGRVAVGNGVPSLGLNHIGPAPSAKGITRPPASVQPTPVGPTLIPDTSYRGPSGTTLNKVPYSARKRQELAENQRATQERLREKALNKKIRDAVIAEQLTRPKSAAPARRSASAKKDPAVRHAAQQFRREHSFVNAAEIDTFAQPYESLSRPQSAGVARSASGPLFTANGKPIAQPGSARKAQQQANFGKPQPADRVGQLVSSSSQSRLSAAELASQPTAGRPSNQGAGNDLASILGGGHEHVIFGNKNSNSAQTRKRIDAPTIDQTEWNNPRAAAQRAVQSYAPYATTALTRDELQAPGLANDQSGAVVVRDELSRETRHAPAAIGFGKGHVGYREYVAKPAAATGIERATRDQEVGTTVDPFRPSAGNSILSWNTDGIDRNSREEDIKRMQQQLWSKTSADYGTKKGAAADPNLDRPVAGMMKGGNRDPLQLSYPVPGEVVAKHVHGPHCGHSKPRPTSASPSKNRGGDAPIRAFNSSSGNPLNPYSSDELENLTSRPANLAAAALGFGKKHAQYKKTILHGMAPEDFIKANQ